MLPVHQHMHTVIKAILLCARSSKPGVIVKHGGAWHVGATYVIDALALHIVEEWELVKDAAVPCICMESDQRGSSIIYSWPRNR
jgi:hypothetical protein